MLEIAYEDWAICPYEGVLVGRDTFDVGGVVVIHIAFGSSTVAPTPMPKRGLVAQ